MMMWLARLDTAHFEFIALGRTEREARLAMRAAWGIHRRQTGAEWSWADIAEDVTYIAIEPGTALRDDAPLGGTA